MALFDAESGVGYNQGKAFDLVAQQGQVLVHGAGLAAMGKGDPRIMGQGAELGIRKGREGGQKPKRGVGKVNRDNGTPHALGQGHGILRHPLGKRLGGSDNHEFGFVHAQTFGHSGLWRGPLIVVTVTIKMDE